jgi:hypothetical protein
MAMVGLLAHSAYGLWHIASAGLAMAGVEVDAAMMAASARYFMLLILSRCILAASSTA